MKLRIIQKISRLSVLCALIAFIGKMQAQCSASFVYTLAANGTATFVSTSTPTTSGSSYTWTFGNGNTSVTSGTTVTAFTSYTTNGVYTASLSYFSGTCVSTFTTNIMLNALTGGTCGVIPIISYSQGNNLNNTFISGSLGTVGATTYSWNYGDGSTGFGSPTSHTYSSPGVYPVYLTAINNATQGCIQSTVLPVVAGVVDFTNTPGPNIFTLTSISAPTGTSTNYSWNYGNGQPVYTVTGNPNTSVLYSSNGVYPVTLQITNTNTPGYSSSITKNLVVNTYTSGGCNLQANFNYSQFNGGITLNNTSQGIYSGTTYTWNFGDGNSSSSFSPSHNYSSPGSHTVLLMASNPFSNTCVSVFTMAVNVCSLNFNAVSQTTSSTVNFTGSAVPTSTNAYYYWYFGDGNSAQGTNSFVVSNTYSTGGVFPLTFGISSSVPFCSLAVTSQINSTCTIHADFISTTGPGGLGSFSSTSTGGNNSTYYIWDYGDGASSGGAGVSISHVYLANGTYTVKLIADNGLNCADTAIHSITIANAGTCSASFVYSLNPNGNVNFLSTSAGTGGSTTYTWNFGNGVSNVAVGTPTMSHTYLAPGIYTVTLNLMTGPQGCFSTSSQTIALAATPCSLNANFNALLISPYTFSFTNLSTGTLGATSYTWDFGDGSFGYSINPVHIYTNTGQYQVTLIANNNGWPACLDASTLVVSTSFTCNLFSNFSHTLGMGGVVSFNNSSTYSNLSNLKSYWNFGDGVVSYTTHPNHTYINAGSYLVSLTVQDTTMPVCRDSLAQYINITGIPCNAVSNFTIFPIDTSGHWVAIPSYPWNLSAASWSWGDGTATNTLYTSHQYSVSGTYSVCLTVTASCGSTSSYCVSQFLHKDSQSSPGLVYINVIPPQLTLRINEETINTNYAIYPNPNNGKFTISMDGLSAGQTDIMVYNLLGDCIYIDSFQAYDTSVSKIIGMENHGSGVYLLKLQNGNRVLTKKLVVEH